MSIQLRFKDRMEGVIYLMVLIQFLRKVQPLAQKSVCTSLKVTVCQTEWNVLKKLNEI